MKYEEERAIRIASNKTKAMHKHGLRQALSPEAGKVYHVVDIHGIVGIGITTLNEDTGMVFCLYGVHPHSGVELDKSDLTICVKKRWWQ